MSNKNIICEPYEIGLKNLEVFYNPELLMEDWKDNINLQQNSLQKTIITAATIAALHSSPNLTAQNFIILDNQIEITHVENALNNFEEIKSRVLGSVTLDIPKSKTNFTDYEISEMETLDAYHEQTKKFFISKKKISF